MDTLRRQAEVACRADARVASLLGDQLTLGGALSSSTASVNGHKRVELQCVLSSGGTAALRGESRGPDYELRLTSLQVSVAGQVIDVPVRAGGGGGSSGRGYRSSRDEVIDVASW